MCGVSMIRFDRNTEWLGSVRVPGLHIGGGVAEAQRNSNGGRRGPHLGRNGMPEAYRYQAWKEAGYCAQWKRGPACDVVTCAPVGTGSAPP